MIRFSAWCDLGHTSSDSVPPYRQRGAGPRDGIVDRNPARITGWQHEYRRAADELDDPRSLALPDWESLTWLAAPLVQRSADMYPGLG